MKKEKLLEEYKVTLESLVEKNKFIYSEEFFALDEFEKQKYQKDKMATEAHLSTLCEVLWCDGAKFDSGLVNLFALSIISSMFGTGGWGNQSHDIDYLKKTLKESDFETADAETKAE